MMAVAIVAVFTFRRLAEVGEDRAHRDGFGDEGDDLYLGSAERTQQRKRFIDLPVEEFAQRRID